MNRMKKFASLLLALVMALALAAPALAADAEKGTITIDNAIVNQTYTIYQILKLESYDPAANAYAYKVTPAWKAFLTTGAGKDYFDVDDQDYATWKGNDTTDARVAEFAKLALETAKDMEPAGQETATSSTVTFSGLELGYYLVDSSTGALCGLNTTNPNVTIKEKNGEPTIDKQVKEGDDWKDANDVNIGDTVNFKTTIYAKKGAENYVLHDRMNASQLLFDASSVKVWVDDKEVTTGFGDIVTEGLTDGCTFHITFNQEWLTNLTKDLEDTSESVEIVVTYDATLQPGAQVGTPGNDNETWLDYGDESSTTHDTTKTYTWKFDLHKYANDKTEIQLAGAKFELRTNADDPNSALYFTKNEAGTEYIFAKNGGEGTTKDILTVEGTDIVLEGLDAGTYYLVETEAPNGYNKLDVAVKVEIKSAAGTTADTANTLTATIEQDGEETTAVNVKNQSGSLLPATGGIGTTIFYVVGSILALGAVILLVTKKRMSTK